MPGLIFERLKMRPKSRQLAHTDLTSHPLVRQTPPQGYHKWYPSGLQDWSPVPEGNRNGGTVAEALTRRGPEVRRIFTDIFESKTFNKSF